MKNLVILSFVIFFAGCSKTITKEEAQEILNDFYISKPSIVYKGSSEKVSGGMLSGGKRVVRLWNNYNTSNNLPIKSPCRLFELREHGIFNEVEQKDPHIRTLYLTDRALSMEEVFIETINEKEYAWFRLNEVTVNVTDIKATGDSVDVIYNFEIIPTKFKKYCPTGYDANTPKNITGKALLEKYDGGWRISQYGL